MSKPHDPEVSEVMSDLAEVYMPGVKMLDLELADLAAFVMSAPSPFLAGDL